MISRRPERLGTSKCTDRSKRPGRNNAGSRSAARFVAPMIKMFDDSGIGLRFCFSAGSHRFAQSTNTPRKR